MENREIIIGGELKHFGKKGMKWGVRRYQNKDGTLTEAGKKRYARDIRDNNARKKDNRMKIDGPDARRWVGEDLDRTKKTLDEGSNVLRQIDGTRQSIQKTRTKSMDLSSMSDAELRAKINRAQLERQYSELYAPQNRGQISKGKKVVDNVLEYGGKAIGIASSAVGLAIAINKLMPKE